MAEAPALNQHFLARWLNRDPTFAKMILRGVHALPFMANWDTQSCPQFAYMVLYGHALAQGVRAPSKTTLTAVVAGEFLATYIPDDNIMAENDAREAVVSAAEAILAAPPAARPCTGISVADYTNWIAQARQEGRRTIFGRAIDEYTDQDYPARYDPAAAVVAPAPRAGVQQPAGAVPRRQDQDGDLPAAPQAVRQMTFNQAMRLFGYFTVRVGQIHNIDGTGLIAHAIIALAKRGTVSAQFIRKIVTAMNMELGYDLELDLEAVTTFYQWYVKQYITEENAQDVFNTWIAIFPQTALRLYITLQQASGGGLTAFYTIQKALRTFPTFGWGRIFALFPDEIANFEAAIPEVGNNLYFGYARDLLHAKSTNFKNLAWVAKELLIRVGGDAPLARYRGWVATCQFQGQVDQMIVDFENARQQEVANDEAIRAGVDTYQRILAAFARVAEAPMAVPAPQ